MANPFSFYGVNLQQSGKLDSFPISFLILNIIGAGLSWFIALSWSNVFQSAIDDYKQKQEAKGIITNPVWMNLLLAVISTVFTVAALYLMIKLYQRGNPGAFLPTSTPALTSG
jgi:uncharacterized membrane protein